MMPAGSRTFFPKIHGPVSTTMYRLPTSLLASSIFPIDPSSASTEKPTKSTLDQGTSKVSHMFRVLIPASFVACASRTRDPGSCTSPGPAADGRRIAARPTGSPARRPARPLGRRCFRAARVPTPGGDENRPPQAGAPRQAALETRARHVRALVAPLHRARADDLRERDLVQGDRLVRLARAPRARR